MRETYVWDGEKIVPKTERETQSRISIISDDCEVKSMADGKFYTSKSKLRREYRARGFIEAGSESDKKYLMHQEKPKRRPVQEDVRIAMQKLGYS